MVVGLLYNLSLDAHFRKVSDDTKKILRGPHGSWQSTGLFRLQEHCSKYCLRIQEEIFADFGCFRPVSDHIMSSPYSFVLKMILSTRCDFRVFSYSIQKKLYAIFRKKFAKRRNDIFFSNMKETDNFV